MSAWYSSVLYRETCANSGLRSSIAIFISTPSELTDPPSQQGQLVTEVHHATVALLLRYLK